MTTTSARGSRCAPFYEAYALRTISAVHDSASGGRCTMPLPVQGLGDLLEGERGVLLEGVDTRGCLKKPAGPRAPTLTDGSISRLRAFAERVGCAAWRPRRPCGPASRASSLPSTILERHRQIYGETSSARRFNRPERYRP